VHRATPILLGVLFLFSPGCGSEERKVENGLAQHDEASTPESPSAMGQTEAERQKQLNDEMAKKQAEDFDAANGKKQ
jgi:hypothetical protein